MRRREFITLAGGVAASLPRVTRAQQAAKLPVIGVLLANAKEHPIMAPSVAAFITALAEFGWTDGNNRVRGAIRAGETVVADGVHIPAPRDLPLGHKLARRAIRAGDKVIKYGAPIGTATVAIRAGEHVHVHNLVSDYTPTYTLDAAKAADGRRT